MYILHPCGAPSCCPRVAASLICVRALRILESKNTPPDGSSDPGEEGRDRKPPVPDAGTVDERGDDIGVFGGIWFDAEGVGGRVCVLGVAVYFTVLLLVEDFMLSGVVQTYQAISSLTHQVKNKMRKMLRPVSPPHTLHPLCDVCRRVLSLCSQKRLFHHFHIEKSCMWSEAAQGHARLMTAIFSPFSPSSTCTIWSSTRFIPRLASRRLVRVARRWSAMRCRWRASCCLWRSASLRGMLVGNGIPWRVSSSGGLSGNGVINSSSELMVESP